MLCTTRSSKWLLEQRCHGYQRNGCTWRIRLTTDESDVWTVKQFNPAHTCTGSQNNVSPTQLDVHVIADAVTPFVQARPHVRIKLLQTEIHTMYGRQISYKKAWNGKQRAIERIYGNWEESYNELPTLMKAIQDRNYGTEVEFVTIEWTTEEGDTITQFNRVFWSFAPSIEGFKHCPPVLVVDGTFMTGKYKHTLLMASSFDGNKNIFTVAFAIVDVESKETWEWFFDCIQRRVTQRRGVCVISDRHVGIVSAMEKIQFGWHWRWCARHYVSNYNKSAKNPTMKKRLMNLAKRRSFRKLTKGATRFARDDPVNKKWALEDQLYWSRAVDARHDGARWNQLTSNMAESVNGAFKSIRALPVAALVESTFY
ncbi:hypothetical protein LINPERHAP2_LOCUS32439, partial [Linum perenne]